MDVQRKSLRTQERLHEALAALGDRDSLRTIVCDASDIGEQRRLIALALTLLDATPHPIALLALNATVAPLLARRAAQRAGMRASGAISALRDSDRAALRDVFHDVAPHAAAAALSVLAAAGAFPPRGDAQRKRLIAACLNDAERSAQALTLAAHLDAAECRVLTLAAISRPRSAAAALTALIQANRLPPVDNDARRQMIAACAADPFAALQAMEQAAALAAHERDQLLHAIARHPSAAAAIMRRIDAAGLRTSDLTPLVDAVLSHPIAAASAFAALARSGRLTTCGRRQQLLDSCMAHPTAAARALSAAAALSRDEQRRALVAATSEPSAAAAALRALFMRRLLPEPGDDLRMEAIAVIARDYHAAAQALTAASDLTANERGLLIDSASLAPTSASLALRALAGAAAPIDAHQRTQLIAVIARHPYAAANALWTAQDLTPTERDTLANAAASDPSAAAIAITALSDQRLLGATPHSDALTEACARDPHASAVALGMAWNDLTRDLRCRLMDALNDPFLIVDVAAQIDPATISDDERARFAARILGTPLTRLADHVQTHGAAIRPWMQPRKAE